MIDLVADLTLALEMARPYVKWDADRPCETGDFREFSKALLAKIDAALELARLNAEPPLPEPLPPVDCPICALVYPGERT